MVRGAVSPRHLPPFLRRLNLGIEPRFEIMPADTDPWAYVWSLNGQRRDLKSDEQRYLIWKSCEEQSESWQVERARIAEEANARRAAAAEQGRVGRAAALSKDAEGEFSASTHSGRSKPTSSPRGQGTAAKATASHTNRGAVERMDKLAKDRPDLAEKVRAGEVSAAAAIR